MNDFLIGAKKSIPVAIGYVPLGIACGVLLISAGFNWWQIGLMSLLVFGGSAQFMAASLILSRTELAAIIPIVLLLNARQMLLTSSLSQYLKGESNLNVAILSQLTADETYALNISEFKKSEHDQGDWSIHNAIGLALTGYLTWVVSTVLGGVLGNFIVFPDVIMNYVLIAMFIGLLIPQITTRLLFTVTLLTTVITIIGMNWFQPSIMIIISTLAGSLIGHFIEQRTHPIDNNEGGKLS